MSKNDRIPRPPDSLPHLQKAHDEMTAKLDAKETREKEAHALAEKTIEEEKTAEEARNDEVLKIIQDMSAKIGSFEHPSRGAVSLAVLRSTLNLKEIPHLVSKIEGAVRNLSDLNDPNQKEAVIRIRHAIRSITAAIVSLRDDHQVMCSLLAVACELESGPSSAVFKFMRKLRHEKAPV